MTIFPKAKKDPNSSCSKSANTLNALMFVWFPSSRSHSLKFLSISSRFMLLYVLRLLISGILVLRPLPSMRPRQALFPPLLVLAFLLMAALLAKTEDFRKKESSAIHGKTSSQHLLVSKKFGIKNHKPLRLQMRPRWKSECDILQLSGKRVSVVSPRYFFSEYPIHICLISCSLHSY